MAWTEYLNFAVALLFVIALIGVAALVARRFGWGYAPPGRSGRRLAVAEILPLDGRRRAVLLKRDGIGHLVILGTGSEIVVETGIPMPGGAAAGSTGTDDHAS